MESIKRKTKQSTKTNYLCISLVFFCFFFVFVFALVEILA